MKRNILLLVILCCLFLSFAIVNAQQLLFINEFLASNDSCCADEFGGYDDWLEIYNAGTESVDIGGMYITDDLLNPTLWQIPVRCPDSTQIPAGGFLVLWCDKEEEQGILHVKLKLSGGGEQIGLFADDGVTPIDTLTYCEQTADTSYGRSPDGSDVWQLFIEPTPGSTNSASGIEAKPGTNNIPGQYFLSQNYPNPFNPVTHFSYQLPVQNNVTIKIYNLRGEAVKTLVNTINKKAGSYRVQWDGTDYLGLRVTSGIYLCRIKAGNFCQVRKMLMVK